jgi:hypothetical protein
MAGDATLRRSLGEAGRAYTDHYYRWPSIIDRYSNFLEQVIERGRQPSLNDGAVTRVVDALREPGRRHAGQRG